MEGSVKVHVFLCFLMSMLIMRAQTTSGKPLFSAVYVFGDSTVDPGNNNNLSTLAKANFNPYGQDFLNSTATGRFTNGKLATDILSGLVGLPELVAAYMDPDFKGEKMVRGASFASAAAGLHDTTSNLYNVISLGKQVDNFRKYKEQLANMTGQENANKIVSEALFVISIGTNDFLINYYLNPFMRRRYNVTQWQDLLTESLAGFVQNISKEGATRLAIIGVPPFGCLPAQITLRNPFRNSCYEKLNEVAASFNAKIMNLTQQKNGSIHGLRIDYYDLYGKVYDIIKRPNKYGNNSGFGKTSKGCCGRGYFVLSMFCNKGSPSCSDASKYVFWDGHHPTSKVYDIIANDFFHRLLKT